MTEKEEIENLMKEAMNDRYQGKYPEAMDKFDAVIKKLAESDEKWAKLKIGEGQHQLGVTLQNKGKDYKAALSCLWCAIAYRKAIYDNVGLAYSYFQVPMCKLARGDKKEDVLPDFRSAKLYIQTAISLLENTKEAKILGDMYQNLAYIHQQLGEIRSAIAIYNRALACRERSGDERGKGLTLARMAEIEKDPQKAEEYLDEAEKIFEKIKDTNRLKQVKETREKIYKR